MSKVKKMVSRDKSLGLGAQLSLPFLLDKVQPVFKGLPHDQPVNPEVVVMKAKIRARPWASS